MKNRRIAPVVLALMALAAAACSHQSYATPARERISFRTQDGVVAPIASLPVASTDEARARGLMGRTSLAQDDGMIFVPPGPTRTSFWMKDTQIPLSIAFWDSYGKIVDILDMAPCTADPCPHYTSRSDYVAAVEMNQGWFSKHGVRIGDHVSFG